MQSEYSIALIKIDCTGPYVRKDKKHYFGNSEP